MPRPWNPFLRFPRLALFLTLLACSPVVFQQLRVRSEVEVVLEGDQRNLTSYEKVRKILLDSEVLVVDLELADVFTPESIDIIRRLSTAFQRQEGVVDVKSLTHSYKPVRSGLSFEMVPLVPEGSVTPRQLAALRRWSLQHPLVRNLMVAEDGHHTLLMVTYQRDLREPSKQRVFDQEVREILRPFRESGVPCRVLALPLIEEELRTTLRHDLTTIIPLAAVVLAAILWGFFRSVRLMLIILGNQLFVLLMLPGLIQTLGQSMTVFSIMLILLLTGVHLTLLAHVYAGLQQAWRSGLVGVAAVEEMLKEVFRSSVFAALTTAVGLFSFVLTDVPQVREIGLFGSFGIVFLFFMTFGPGISLILVLPHRFLSGGIRWRSATGPGDDYRKGRDWAARWTKHVIRWRWLIFASTFLLVGIAVGGIVQLRTDIRAVEFLSPHSSTRQAVEAFDRLYGGVNVVQIEFDSGRTNGVNDLEFLQYIEAVQAFAERQPEVSGAYSYAQLLAMMNQIWEGESSGIKLPNNSMLVALFAVALQSEDYPFLTALADPSLEVAYLVLRSRDMPSRRYLAMLDRVLNFARERKPAGVQISAASGIHSILEADRRIVRSQERTAGATALSIWLLLVVLWRSPRLAFYSVGINLLAVAAVVALAGYVDVPLNSITMMVAALALGITVDDSVHFLTHWRACRQRGETSRMAVEETLRVKGRPIVATSVALMAIFGLFTLWSFPPVVHFGLLCAAAFLVALAAVLWLLPAVLIGFGQGQEASPPSSQTVKP